jgi:hypothetical protein
MSSPTIAKVDEEYAVVFVLDTVHVIAVSAA